MAGTLIGDVAVVGTGELVFVAGVRPWWSTFAADVATAGRGGLLVLGVVPRSPLAGVLEACGALCEVC